MFGVLGSIPRVDGVACARLGFFVQGGDIVTLWQVLCIMQKKAVWEISFTNPTLHQEHREPQSSQK